MLKSMGDLQKELQEDLQRLSAKEKLDQVIQKIVHFYMTHLNVQEDEVAIFLTNKQKTALSFAYPSYLVSSGFIPVDSPDAVVSHIYRSGSSFINNKFLEKEH